MITNAGIEIRFRYYTEEAPRSCDAFNSALPLTRVMYHARVSGQEIWFDNLPELDIIQENASVFTVPGEVVLGPSRPKRTKTAGCFGIYYGEGKGLDACNIFACVADEDREKLTSLGENIWKNGAIEVRFESLDQ
ncbi:MAG: DUF3830 family protein [Ignavibacteriaceae bacterium]|nr:DUF3830 family protein [Ignavibacteriaceae bacterium]